MNIPAGGTVKVEKKWHAPNGTDLPDSITVTLQYRAKSGADNEWKEFLYNGKVTLNEGNGWTYAWTNLPQNMQGIGEVEYQVVEADPGEGYLEVNEDDGSDYKWTFVNVSTTSLTVTKEWKGVAEADQKVVEVQLYRSTDGSTTNGTPVEGATLTLSAVNWTGTFEDLPAYDADGKPYTYYAKEVSVGGVPVDSDNFDFIVTYDPNKSDEVFTIINTDKTEVTGTKTWVGGSDSSIQLNLYRTIDSNAADNPSAYPMHGSW